jgi:DNA-binding response OmpR family regulator
MTLPLHGRWILIAENNAMTALNLQLEFEKAGAHVTAAFSLGQAMTLLDQQGWAGAVLDCELGGEDCSPLCTWFLEQQIPFIICSGSGYVGVPCSHSIQLVKPVTAEELVNSMLVLVTPASLEASQTP